MQLIHYLTYLNKTSFRAINNSNKCLLYQFARTNFSTDQPKDYYKILGVPKTATESEIKSAYTKLSKKYHPDMNKAADANDRFAEINNAYETLRDPQKRKQYDITGDPSQQYYETSSGNPFSGYSSGSIFDDLFSNLFTSRSREQQQYYSKQYSTDQYGSNLQIALSVSFEEAALGAKIPTRFQRIIVCEECKGSKTKSGKPPITCSTCKGRGVSTTMQGNMIMQTTCYKCNGSGKLITDPCTKCKGNGRTLQTIVEEIEVPQGIDHGQQYKISGLVKNNCTDYQISQKGNHGTKSNGDLIVTINVQPSKYYKRQGFDVSTKLKLKLIDAIFGTTVKIKTLHGEKEIKIQQGAQFGEKIRIPNFRGSLCYIGNRNTKEII